MLNSWISPQCDAPARLHWEAAWCSSWRHLAFISSHVGCRNHLHLPLKLAARMWLALVAWLECLKSPTVLTKRPTESYARNKKEFTATIFGKAHASHVWKCFSIPWAHGKHRIPVGSEGSQCCLGIQRSGGQAVASEQQELSRESGKRDRNVRLDELQRQPRAAPPEVSLCCSAGLTLCSLALTVSLDSVPSL